MEKFENIQISTTDNYTVPEMAKLFHSFPRISVLTFQPVSNEFDLNLEDSKLELNPYFMSLLFYPAVCAVLLFLSVLITGIVSCCMCCRNPPESKSGNVKCLKFFIVAFSILIGCSTAIGGYGNYQCNLGTKDLVQSSDNISTHVSSIHDEVQEMKDSLGDTLYSLQILQSAYDDYLKGIEESGKASADLEQKKADLEVVETSVKDVENKLDQAQSWRIFNHNNDMAVIKTFIVQMEFMRHICTWSLLGWCALISFVVFLAILCTSEVFLMVGAVMGIFGLISALSITSWYIVHALGVADFCMDPHRVFYNQTDFSQTDMAYFLNCPQYASSSKLNKNHPYYSDLKNAYEKYDESNKSLEKLKEGTEDLTTINKLFGLIQRNMDDVKTSLDTTISKAECTVVHANLVSGLNAICYTYLEGIDFVFGAGLITAICLFILIILSACTWGQMDRHGDIYAGSYDHLDDPYRRTGGGMRNENGRYGMYAGGNYHRLGPAAGTQRAADAGVSHPPPPSYVQSVA